MGERRKIPEFQTTRTLSVPTGLAPQCHPMPQELGCGISMEQFPKQRRETGQMLSARGSLSPTVQGKLRGWGLSPASVT
jgi:hypothetical protein